MKTTLKLTNKERKALETLLLNHNSCRNGCVYPEMENKEEDCDECEFQKCLDNILEKIEEGGIMELMSIQDARNLINRFKKIYPNDYKDINLEHGGVHLIKMGNLEKRLKIYKNDKYASKYLDDIALSIQNQLILNEYDFLDIATINLYSPIDVVSITNEIPLPSREDLEEILDLCMKEIDSWEEE